MYKKRKDIFNLVNIFWNCTCILHILNKGVKDKETNAISIFSHYENFNGTYDKYLSKESTAISALHPRK